MTLGEKIRHMRKVRGMTSQELADRIGVTQPTIIRYENDQVKKPKMDVIFNIAKALQVSLDFFLNEDARTPLQVAGDKLPPELVDFIISEKSMPYLIIAKEAADKEIPEDALRSLIDALYNSMEYRKQHPLGEHEEE